MKTGALYIVATPIGNLEDITLRAIDILKAADLIAAEDTRHSQILLQHYNIHTPLLSLHEHNETLRVNSLLNQLAEGQHIALISDAGTPLISDPGHKMVHAAIAAGFSVIPVPGACAVMAALMGSGLSAKSFRFLGFLPRGEKARNERLKTLYSVEDTLIFYESPHRILTTLEAMKNLWGKARLMVLARELTKTFETFLRGTIEEVCLRVQEETDQQKGEMVILVEGISKPICEADSITGESERILKILLKELSLKSAAALTAEITGERKNRLYQAGLKVAEASS